MDGEELEERFKATLEEFNGECQKRGRVQEIVTYNDHGVFLNFYGVGVNYSISSLAKEEIQDYLVVQEEAHKIYLRTLQNHRLEMKKELKGFNSFWLSFFQRFSKSSAVELEEIIGRTKLQVSFDKVLRDGALLGKYFFEEIVVDYTKNNLDEIRQRLIIANQNIYENAQDLLSIDQDRLHYFRHKNHLWYEKGQS